MFLQYGAKSGSGMLISTSVEGLLEPRKSAKRDSGPQPGRENFSLAANEVIICNYVHLQGCQMAKFDPFLSLDCARVVHMYLDDFTRLFRGYWVT